MAVASPVYVETKRRQATEGRLIERMGELRQAPRRSTPGKPNRLAARLRRSEQRKGVPMPRKDVPCAGCGITVPAPASRYQHEACCPAWAPAWQEARAERKRAYNAKRAHAEAALARAARVGACLDCGAETRPNLINRFARLPQRCPTCSERRADERERAYRREWMRRYRAQKRV